MLQHIIKDSIVDTMPTMTYQREMRRVQGHGNTIQRARVTDMLLPCAVNVNYVNVCVCACVCVHRCQPSTQATLARNMLGRSRFYGPLAASCEKFETLKLLHVLKTDPADRTPETLAATVARLQNVPTAEPLLSRDDDYLLSQSVIMHRLGRGLCPIHRLLPEGERRRPFFCYILKGELSYSVLSFGMCVCVCAGALYCFRA